jgi:hypothetical protein
MHWQFFLTTLLRQHERDIGSIDGGFMTDELQCEIAGAGFLNQPRVYLEY